MKIIPIEAQKSSVGSSANFTGIVRREPLFDLPAPATMAASNVTFEPGGRTVWHTHPLGQALIIVSGAGWVQSWGQERRDVRVGDVVWIEPEEKHWHGARSDTAMTHTAITESLNGKFVDWMEPVTDEQYCPACAAAVAATLGT